MRPALDLATIEALIADMDGVLWRGRTPLPGVPELFSWLAAEDIPVVLATNNSSRRPEAYEARLAEMGVAVDRSQILTSALATADWLRRTYPQGASVYVVGQEGIRTALAEAGFEVVGEEAERVDFDLTYDKLAAAARAVRQGARFVGTNGDLTYPSSEGLLPGAGAILAAIEAASGVAPLKIGKPESIMFEVAVSRLGRPPGRTVMLGDRLDTDIAGAARAGLRTVLVTTGVHDPEAAQRSDVQPDLTVSGLPEFLVAWRRARPGREHRPGQ
jgi:4-nitrophenyl phosphatase